MGTPFAVRPLRYYGQDSQHSAFPGAVRLPDGRFLVVYRQGSNHYTNRDGSIVSAVSDTGETWSAPTTVVSYAGDGVDCRDPSVSLSADGHTLYLTYFRGTAGNPAIGSFIRRSEDYGQTWGPEYRIDGGMTSSAITSPAIEVSGRLLAFHYSKPGTETYWSVFKAASDDGGVTWNSARLMSGQMDGRDYPEPYAIAKDGRVFLAFRWGANAQIGSMSSEDGGEHWSAPAVRFNGSGRPTSLWLADGSILVALRDVNNGRLSVRSTPDVGATWYPPRVVQYPPDHGMSTYVTFLETEPGKVFAAMTAEESTGTVSRLGFAYLANAGSETLYGITPADDNTVVTSVFDYPEGSAPPYPWVVGGGVVVQGGVQSAVADNVPDFVVQSTAGPDQSVTADLMWIGQAGLGVVLRYKDPSNWILFTSETGGSVLRLYKSVGGTVTLLSSASWSVAAGAYHTFTASVRGGQIRAGVDGDTNLRCDLSAADNAALSGWSAGVKLNSQPGGLNTCRRLSIVALS